MRIGISMLSHDEHWGGPGTCTRELVRNLLEMDQKNDYVLIYPRFGGARLGLGQYRRYPNVTEIATDHSRVPILEYWSQVVVPKVAQRHGIDVFFDPFMSVPIRGRFKKVMILPGIEFYTVPEAFDLNTALRWGFMDKFVLPAADRVISISNTMTEDFHRIIGYPVERMRTIYLGVARRFRVITDRVRIAEVRRTYQLPDKFILFVGRIFPSKNLATLLRAFAAVRDRIPHRLVIVGKPRWKYRRDLDLIHQLQLSDRVTLLDFVPGEDLPVIYNLADCFVYPSFYESFGFAQVEAMACGCPVVAAAAGACPEVTGGAALLVDPHSADEVGAAIVRVVTESGLRKELVRKGLARAAKFTWERCAGQVLDVLEECAADAGLSGRAPQPDPWPRALDVPA